MNGVDREQHLSSKPGVATENLKREEARAVPGDDGRRLHDDEELLPARPEPREAHPKEPVERTESRAGRPVSAKHRELVAQRQILEEQRGATRHRGRERGEKQVQHRSACDNLEMPRTAGSPPIVDDNLHVAPQGRQKAHQPLSGEPREAPAEQG